MSKRRFTQVGRVLPRLLVVAGIAGIAFWAFTLVYSYQYTLIARQRAMLTVGRAGVDYLRECGTPPVSVDELLAAGLLRLDESTGLLVSVAPGAYGVALSDARAVRLCFPRTADGWVLVDGAVVSTEQHRPIVLVAHDGVPAEMQASVNRMLGVQWFEAMNALHEEGQDGN
ncbi:MAG: hypothetical protein PVJ57_22680 [Phycisphaerae bacterium]